MAASTVRLQVSDYSQLFDYTVLLQLYLMISENEAADTPMIFEEFVIVVINFVMVLCNKNFIRNVFPKQVLV